MQKAIQGDEAEIKMGKLAEQKGQNAQLRQSGKTLVHDHGANLAKAKSIARSMNISIPNQPSTKQKAAYHRLSNLKGASFDAQFAKEAVRDHKKDIAEFRSEAATSGKVANFAKQSLPTLKKHLKIAQSLPSETTGSK